MMDKMGVRKHLSTCDYLPFPNSNNGYSPIDIIEAFMVSIWCGANRFLHTEITRHDKVLGRIFGWRRTPANDTYKRFFRKFDMERSSSLSQSLFGWVFKNIDFNRYTLDCDSSILTRYGDLQEGAQRGYTLKNQVGNHIID